MSSDPDKLGVAMLVGFVGVVGLCVLSLLVALTWRVVYDVLTK